MDAMIDGPLRGRGSCRGAPVLAPPIPPWGTPGVRPGISASPATYAVHLLFNKAVSRVEWILVIIFVLLQSVAPLRAAAQEPAKVWSEFVAKLRAGTLTAADIRAEYTTPEQQLTWLKQLKDASDARKGWADWEDKPEIFTVGNHVQVLARVNEGTQYLTLCFTFLIDGQRWYYSHMETITLRLDKVGPPPLSKFPDIAEETKSWIREENYWSTIIGSLYLPLAKEKGADFALRRLLDGPGFFAAVKTWVPFLPPPRAFILYLCWEQSILRGNKVTLERLDDGEAVVRMETRFFQLYRDSSHMKTWISFPDYRRIFETIWTDRAEAAGWKVAFEYEDKEGLQCLLRFSRK